MAKRKYRQVNQATKQKMSIAHKGKKHSPDIKRKISKKLKDYWRSVPDNPSISE